MIRHGREASAEEVATELGVPLQRYYQLDQRVSNAMMLSLADEAVAEAAEEALAHEARFPGPFLDPALVVESKDLIEKLAVITEQLSPRERLVVTLYYCEELTLQEIGEVLNLTEGRISQILSKTIVGLRQTLMTETCHPTSRQSSPHLPYNKKYARAEAPIA
jgi:RNA polymerase sigma factor for flagellar operon FliA